MYGNTPLIESFLNQGINVNFLVLNRRVLEDVMWRAINHFRDRDAVDMRKSSGVIDFPDCRFQLYSLNSSSRFLSDRFRGFRGVILLHPELEFKYGKDEELYNVIKLINARILPYGNT